MGLKKCNKQMTSPLLNNAYLRFVRLMESMESSKSFAELDSLEKKLLEYIATHECAGTSLLVGDIIYLNGIGSPATLHRRLANLEKLGFIRHGQDIDGRKKCIELTPKARDYFFKMGRFVVKAAQLSAS